MHFPNLFGDFSNWSLDLISFKGADSVLSGKESTGCRWPGVAIVTCTASVVGTPNQILFKRGDFG